MRLRGVYILREMEITCKEDSDLSRVRVTKLSVEYSAAIEAFKALNGLNLHKPFNG